MRRERLDSNNDGVKIVFSNNRHCSDLEDELQDSPRHSVSDKRPRSPRSSKAGGEDIWQSLPFETAGSNRLEGISNDSWGPSASTGNTEYDEDDFSDLLAEEGGLEDFDTIPVFGCLAADPTDSQCLRGGVQSETSHAIRDPFNTNARACQTMGSFTEPLEETGAQPSAGSPVGQSISTNTSDSQPPNFGFVIEDFGVGYSPALSASDGSVTSFANRIESSRNAAELAYDSTAPIEQDIHDTYTANSHEIARIEQQTPKIAIGIRHQCEGFAAETQNAFSVDTDLAAIDVAATNYADKSSSPVKRHRPSGNSPTIQTPTKNLQVLQHWQNQSPIPWNSSTTQSSLQVPTPPLSFKDLPPCQPLNGAYVRSNPSSTQATPSCLSPIRPPSPVSPLPMSLSSSADANTRCPDCPDTVFTGTPKAQKNSLQRHMRDCHRGLLRLDCLVQGCTVTFAPGRKDNRLKHVRAMHRHYPLPASSTKRKRKGNSEG